MPDVKDSMGKVIRSYRGKTDAGIYWRLDMMKVIGRLPAQSRRLARRSSSVTPYFLITSNGVDEGHINIPKPLEAEAHRRQQEEPRSHLEEQFALGPPGGSKKTWPESGHRKT